MKVYRVFASVYEDQQDKASRWTYNHALDYQDASPVLEITALSARDAVHLYSETHEYETLWRRKPLPDSVYFYIIDEKGQPQHAEDVVKLEEPAD